MELVAEVLVGLTHFAAKLFSGFAQLALRVASCPLDFLARFPARVAEIVIRSPDVVLGSPEFGAAAVPVVVPASSG